MKLAILGFTLAAYAVLVFGYATLTPIWQNPDEPAHYNYVAHVAATAGLPELRPGDWDAALLERLKNGRLQPGDSVAAIQYEAWQPPLFYLLAAPLLRLGPSDDLGALVYRLRAFDAVLGGLTLGVAFLVAREVLAADLALAVPLTIVGVPMFTAVSAAISADPLANLEAATALLALLRRLEAPSPRGRGELRWSLVAGALIGVGLLTKLALGIFVPLALVVVAVRSSRPLRDGVLLLGAAGVVVLPWLVHQVTTYGWSDPLGSSRHAAVVLDQPRFPGLSADYVGDFLTTSFHSFWAQFGWMGIVAPERLYLAWGVLVLVALVGLVVVPASRRRFRDPAWLLLVGVIGVGFLAYVGYNLVFKQFQGRYLFTVLVPVAVLLVAGWEAWLPGRRQAWGALLVACVLVGLNAYALVRVLVPGFAPMG